MWELDHKEGWMPKNRCFQKVVLEKTLESPLDSKQIKLVNPKENQPWIYIAKTDPETEAPILWPSDAKSRLTGKDPDAGKDWRQEEKGVTEGKMVGWHHRLIGHEFEQTLGHSGAQEAWLVAVHGVAKSWTRTELTDWLNQVLTIYQLSSLFQYTHKRKTTQYCTPKRARNKIQV